MTSAATNLKIREVTHNSPEYRATVELRDRVLRQPLGLVFTPEDLAAELDSHHLAAYQDKVLVGCLVLKPASKSEIQMRQVAVVPELQRQGIGKALVVNSEIVARKLGYRRLFLHAREEAVPFYENLAYKKIGDCFIEVTIPHWEMEKML